MSQEQRDMSNAVKAETVNREQDTLGLIMDVPLIGTIQTQTQTPRRKRNRHKTIHRVCSFLACGRDFQARLFDIRRGGRRGLFCSPLCSRRANLLAVTHRADQSGEANGNFKGWASRNKRAYVNRFRSRYPEKAQAHDAVKNALAKGILVRPKACSRCTGSCHPAAHHEDYSRPLDVVFVCRKCHRELDELRRQRLALANIEPVKTVLLPVYEMRTALFDPGQDAAEGDQPHHEGFAAPESVNQLSR